MMLRCDEIDDLLAPFALDALDEPDRQAVLEHLADCRLHDADLAGYRDVASALAGEVEAVAPPARLQAGLLAAFNAEASGEQVATLQPTLVRRTGLAQLVRKPAFAYGLAAALLVVALGLAWGLASQDGGGGAGSVLLREVDRDDMHMRMLYDRTTGVALISVDMPPLQPGRDYQAWQITEGGPVSLGVLENQGTVVIQADLSGASAMAITVEPAGGSPAPTSDPVLVSEF
jgi:anti-sigma-K factor RskA